ncbi:MAG: hypothetical protein R3F37_06455 [Candidatus Competibacteraceae bacterium]
MLDSLALLGAGCGALLFLSAHPEVYLRYFQQEEYNGKRFLAWYRRYHVLTDAEA